MPCQLTVKSRKLTAEVTSLTAEGSAHLCKSRPGSPRGRMGVESSSSLAGTHGLPSASGNMTIGACSRISLCLQSKRTPRPSDRNQAEAPGAARVLTRSGRRARPAAACRPRGSSNCCASSIHGTASRPLLCPSRTSPPPRSDHPAVPRGRATSRAPRTDTIRRCARGGGGSSGGWRGGSAASTPCPRPAASPCPPAAPPAGRRRDVSGWGRG
eukprot:COSAG04_NODE_2730_length_3668_cov_5.074250_3_plen_213_part_00